MRDQGKSLENSANAAGMCERTARSWKTGPLPSQVPVRRDWRTRADPFEPVWAQQILPLLFAPGGDKLHAKVLFDQLKWPDGGAPAGSVRTLHRRIAAWRIVHGPEKEVYFPQNSTPGAIAGFDFTCCNELKVTVAGKPFPHLFFEYYLVDSGWRDLTLARSETYEAMTQGLQNAFWRSGGVPVSLRHDNLSAAVRELSTGRKGLTMRYAAFLEAYSVGALPITPLKSNENGGCEQSHYRWKLALGQALILRGHRDFSSESAYWAFCVPVRDALNAACESAYTAERAALRPLPAARLPDYTMYEVRVRKWSTIHFCGRTYSVPSRLIGSMVTVRQFAQSIEVWYKEKTICRFERAYGGETKRIDYRHVIHWLVRKPGAFASYVHREDMFPTVTFRRSYDAIVAAGGANGPIEYLRVLELAARLGQEAVERALAVCLGSGQTIDACALGKTLAPRTEAAPFLLPHTPDFASYDSLLHTSAAQGAQ